MLTRTDLPQSRRTDLRQKDWFKAEETEERAQRLLGGGDISQGMKKSRRQQAVPTVQTRAHRAWARMAPVRGLGSVLPSTKVMWRLMFISGWHLWQRVRECVTKHKSHMTSHVHICMADSMMLPLQPAGRKRWLESKMVIWILDTFSETLRLLGTVAQLQTDVCCFKLNRKVSTQVSLGGVSYV